MEEYGVKGKWKGVSHERLRYAAQSYWWRRGRPRIKQTLPSEERACSRKAKRAARYPRIDEFADSERGARFGDRQVLVIKP